MRRPVIILCTLLAFTIAAAPGAEAAPPLEFEEDFSTTDYMDAGETTAIWDTGAGEIRLDTYALSEVGVYDPTGIVYDAEPYGRYVLLAASALLVVDMIDPANPVLVGVKTLSGTGVSITAAGRYAYVACGTGGLDIIDMTDPLAPALVGNWATADECVDVAVSGRFAFVADSSGMQVLIISDPTLPDPEGRYARTCYGVDVEGDMVYVAGGNDGLVVLDVRDERTPTSIGNVFTGSVAVCVDVAGDVAYVGNDPGGMVSVDVSSPNAPVLWGQAQMNNTVSVRADGEYLYAADSGWGVTVFGIRDPGQPVQLYYMQSNDKNLAVVPRGRHALMCDAGAGLRVLAAADELSSSFLFPGLTAADAVHEIAYHGGVAYVACGDDGLYSVDINDPTAPVVLDHIFNDAFSVAVHGNVACIASSYNDFATVDVVDPSAMFQIAVGGRAHRVAMDGRHAYVLIDGHLHLYDLRVSSNPLLLDTYTGIYVHATELSQDGNYVVCASIDDGTSFEGIAVFDVTDPGNIVYDGIRTGIGGVTDLVVEGKYVFAVGSFGLVSLEIPASGTPNTLDSDATGSYESLALVGDRLYAGGAAGVDVFDVSDPGNLIYLRNLDEPTQALAASGDYLLTGVYGSNDFGMHEVMQRRLDIANNVAQSTFFYSGDHTPYTALMHSYPLYQNISWEVNTEDYFGWFGLHPYGYAWGHLTGYQRDALRWRATLNYRGGGRNSSCTSMDLEWRYTSATITAVEDVPNDQGRQVRLRWKGSGYDAHGTGEEVVTEYRIFRRIDDPAKVGTRPPASVGDPVDPEAYPPGEWDYLMTVPIAYEDDYAVIVPTLADSTVADGLHETAFFIRTMAELYGWYYDSSVETGWSVDNLAPSPPAAPAQAGPLLSWDEPVDADFDYVTIYGSATGERDGGEVVLGYSSGTSFLLTGGLHPYYLFTATDFSGNESEASVLAEQTTAVGDAPVGRTALLGNHPNPFNPRTTIRYALARDARVRLAVYDLSGRLVRRLADGEPQAAGLREAVWDGRDRAGRAAPAGTYLLRFEADGLSRTWRMMLVK